MHVVDIDVHFKVPVSLISRYTAIMVQASPGISGRLWPRDRGLHVHPAYQTSAMH
jgi:hypothetical protein